MNCHYCEQPIYEDNTHEDPDGNLICEDCYDAAGFIECSGCLSILDPTDEDDIRQETRAIYCLKCGNILRRLEE